MIFRDFLLVGAAIATIIWYAVFVSHRLQQLIPPKSARFISNTFLLSPPAHANASDTSVEWAYAFDVHTNAFFPFYLTLYLAQLFLVPIILKDNWVCLWVGNTLYLAG